jgi:hypothetical protein
MTKSKHFNQIFPLFLALVTLAGVSVFFYFSILILNLFPGTKISTEIRPADVLIGLTIYLKTSIDFAIFIGSLMKDYHGLKNRVAIEVGTAVGNMLGTVAVMVLWYFFKEIKILLGLMVLLASLVLFKLAESSVEHVVDTQDDGHEEKYSAGIVTIAKGIIRFVKPINDFLAPVLDKIIPHFGGNAPLKKTIFGLLALSFSIPFILGLDDFAGYVPLFNVVNVFGFGLGVFLGHAILNILLFINPRATIKAVKNPIVSILGAIAFVALACWGLYEVGHIFIGK